MGVWENYGGKKGKKVGIAGKRARKKRKEKVIRGRIAAYFWKPREITVSKKKKNSVVDSII